MIKKSTLIGCLFMAGMYHGMAQVPLKVWDQVIGTEGNEQVLSTIFPGQQGFQLVKMSYGMALIYTSAGSGQSGNVNTDANPGNKITGVVFGMNHDGSKRFDRRFLAQNCASGSCNVDHYTGFNYEYLLDGVEEGSTGKLLVSGYLNSGTTGDARFITHYEINSNGQTVFGQRLFEPYLSNLNSVLIKYYPGPIADGASNYSSQSFLFAATASSGGINNYIHDDGRTLPYNAGCFNVGDPNTSNIGFIRRNTTRVLDETGVSSTNKANIMGESGLDYPVKVLSEGDKFFPAGLGFLVGAISGSTVNCFWSSPTKGNGDVLLIEVDKNLNKVRDIRIGSSGNEQTFLQDFTFTKDGNILVMTYPPGGSTGAASGDFTLNCPGWRLIKVTRTGQKLWEKCLPKYYNSAKIIADDDGGFFIFGGVGTGKYLPRGWENGSRPDINIEKFDELGNSLWEYRFGSNLSEDPTYVTVSDLGNGEYAFATVVVNEGSAPSGDRSTPLIGGLNDIWVLKFKNYPRHSITINGLDKTEYIPGMYGTVSYSLPANYNYDNQFVVELSDANGSFNAPTFLGNANTRTGGTIPINFRESLAPGNNYRLRIVSSEPRDTSLISAAFSIIPAPANQIGSLALVSLYNSTNGANWTNNTNWLTSNPLKTWYGVTLNEAGRVTELPLYDNNLQGAIPDAIAGLSELYYLALSQNHLKGNIPSSIGNLLQLRTLDLSYNPEISGSIPASIGNLVNLDFLWLGESNSQLSGTLPVSLGNLTNITRLIIAGTQVSGAIPSQLGNLVKLQYLRLNNNQLTGSIPSSLGNLTALTDGLELSNNQLTGSIPASLGNLTNISQLWLFENQLSGAIPSSLTNLTQVRPGSAGIDVSANRFNFDALSSSILPLLSSGRLNFLPQPPLVIHKTGCSLAVTAGGNLASNTYTWLMHNKLDVVITGDSTRVDHQPGMYMVQVQNSEVPGITLYSNWLDASGVVPTQPQELVATSEQTDAEGWTHYDYVFTNTDGIIDYIRLLSLKKNGNDIGTIGDGSFQVKMVATSGAGSGEGLLLTNPLITNTSGTYVMHRYWSVKPTQQPSSPVGVRFYFNDADIDDVKGSVPWVVNASGLFFYKSVGGDPNPETNLNGATAIIGIYEGASPGTDSYVYENLGCGIHRVEYMVSGFSGGGGGGTINGLALPVKLTDFSGVYRDQQTLLKWVTAQEIQTAHFVVERSYDGTTFNAIGQVKAAGNSNIEKRYDFTDAEQQTNAPVVYYRLLTVDLDGRSEYSNVISIKLPGNRLQVKVGPNPAGNRLRLYLPANGYNSRIQIGIYTVQGKPIIQQQLAPSASATRDIDITGLSNGMYILVIESGDIKSRHRFVKRE